MPVFTSIERHDGLGWLQNSCEPQWDREGNAWGKECRDIPEVALGGERRKQTHSRLASQRMGASLVAGKERGVRLSVQRKAAEEMQMNVCLC